MEFDTLNIKWKERFDELNKTNSELREMVINLDDLVKELSKLKKLNDTKQSEEALNQRFSEKEGLAPKNQKSLKIENEEKSELYSGNIEGMVIKEEEAEYETERRREEGDGAKVVELKEKRLEFGDGSADRFRLGPEFGRGEGKADGVRKTNELSFSEIKSNNESMVVRSSGDNLNESKGLSFLFGFWVCLGFFKGKIYKGIFVDFF
jgi:hypothetical protein